MAFHRKIANLFNTRPLRLLVWFISATLLCQCAHRKGASPLPPTLNADSYRSYDSRKFPLTSWSSPKTAPTKVIISLHGYNGYPQDFKALGNKLSKKSIIVYAPAIRGQGFDPIEKHRGDIRHYTQWINDLHTLTRLIRQKHPLAEIIWLGESMGGLIALNAVSPIPEQSCDRLIIAAPILSLAGQISPSQKNLFQITSTLFPSMRFSIGALTGHHKTQMTANSTHDTQTLKNDWHIEKQTLRLYKNLGRLIQQAPDKLSQLKVPLLTIRGAKDSLSDDASLKKVLSHLPATTPSQHIEYAKSHHLLFYDKEKEQVIDDIASWLNTKPLKVPSPPKN